MLADVRDGRIIPDDRLSVRAYLAGWIDRRSDLRPSTVRTWRLALDHLTRRLGTLRLRHLSPTDVETALADMPPWVGRTARTALALSLRDAERDGIVTRNVARLARSPHVTARAMYVPTEADARQLLAVAPTHRLGALVVTALGTAMRQGELLGLTRDCLDLDGGTIRVEWSLGWVAGEPILGPPKTEEGKRTIPCSPLVAAALRSHLARQAEERIAAGRKWRDADGLVFTREDGRPLHPNTARYILDVLAERAGLPHVRFHALRHAALTIVTERRGQKAAQVLAGHANLATTDGYAHPTDALGREATDALREALG